LNNDKLIPHGKDSIFRITKRTLLLFFLFGAMAFKARCTFSDAHLERRDTHAPFYPSLWNVLPRRRQSQIETLMPFSGKESFDDLPCADLPP